MDLKQMATRVDDKQYRLFRATTKKIGTTPADALRMFIYAFNEHGGFPYDVKTNKSDIEPFDSEADATRFATEYAIGAINETQ